MHKYTQQQPYIIDKENAYQSIDLTLLKQKFQPFYLFSLFIHFLLSAFPFLFEWTYLQLPAYVYNFRSMEQQEQYILEDDALRVLSLFPKRQVNILAPSSAQYSQLYASLTCSICLQLFTNPVYLRCSHRFCKQCIEKHIRSSPKKSCPNCRGGLTTKRDLRSDFNLQSLITFAFGDPKKFTERLGDLDPSRQRGTQLRRAQSQTDLKVRGSLKMDTAQQVIASLTSLKRSKTMDGEEVRPRKRGPSQKKIKPQPPPSNNGAQSQKQMTSAQRSKLLTEIRDIKKEMILPPPRPRKKRNAMVIQIQSSQPAQVQEILREQFQIDQNSNQDPSAPVPFLFPPLSSLNLSKINMPQQNRSISMIPEVSQMDSIKKMSSIRDMQVEAAPVKGQEDNEPMMEEIDEKKGKEKMDKMEEEVPIVSPEVMTARQCLQQQFGGNFLNKIIQLSDYSIFMRLSILKHPMHPFTPDTTFSQIKILARTSINPLLSLISSDLNINKQAIKIYVCEDNNGNYIEVSNNTKLHQINNRFWRTFGGFQLLEIWEYFDSIEKEPSYMNRYEPTWKNRVLYYTVDYSKIIL